MESLQIRTGAISLRILDDNGDERGIFKFNPEDIESAKTIYRMQSEVIAKEAEFTEREKECKTEEEKIEFLTETVDYFRNLVDACFGEGSSNILFGDAKSLTMFSDFFEGIMPYYDKASKARMSKYKKPKK